MSMVISRFSFSEFRAMSGWQVCDSNRRQRWWCDDILSLLASLSPIITVGFHAELPRELRQVSIMLSWHHSSWQRSISWHVWRVTWHLLRTFTKTMQSNFNLSRGGEWKLFQVYWLIGNTLWQMRLAYGCRPCHVFSMLRLRWSVYFTQIMDISTGSLQPQYRGLVDN